MPQDLLGVTTVDDLSAALGVTTRAMTGIVYGIDNAHRYVRFEIPKKGGGCRIIKSPCRRLKNLQRSLSDALYDIYSPNAAVHGFARQRSVVTNARAHLHKQFVFNVDLETYFDTITYQRVRGLFLAHPFHFSESVATLIADTCCFDGVLPQGAPTSPVVANMISRRLDGELLSLARRSMATYTRYADDITFSFTCARRGLPVGVVEFRNRVPHPGAELVHIVESNGFTLNSRKIRLSGRHERMEVTGLAVNEFPNVRRRYVRQTRSMLYAWETHGLAAAQREFNEVYDQRHRPSGEEKSLVHVVRGKLTYLRSVRGGDDAIFNRLAGRYNRLVDCDGLRLKLRVRVDSPAAAAQALWALETLYDDDNGNAIVGGGTGFDLVGIGIVTCAHVVRDRPVTASRRATPHLKHEISVDYLDLDRDIAVCSLTKSLPEAENTCSLELASGPAAQGARLTLLGFPNDPLSATHYAEEVQVSRFLNLHGVSQFEISAQIRHGNSGGPLVDHDGRVVGVALRGIDEGGMVNAALHLDELRHVAAACRMVAEGSSGDG